MPSFDAWESEQHRSYFGFCLEPCEHPECHEALEPPAHNEQGDPGA